MSIFGHTSYLINVTSQIRCKKFAWVVKLKCKNQTLEGIVRKIFILPDNDKKVRVPGTGISVWPDSAETGRI
jgi:hypothetical protein